MKAEAETLAWGRWLGLLLLLLPGFALAEQPVPPLSARVTDLTNTLAPSQRQALEQKLAALEAEKGSQIAVLIVPTTQPESIEQYGIRVAEQWKLGRKGVDDGVLLLVAKDDRALRIEVGYGLEGVIPDAVAKRIIEGIIVPRFREGDFDAGISAGADALVRLVSGEPLPEPAMRPSRQADDSLPGNVLPMALVFVFMVGGLLRAIFGRLLGASVAAGVAGFGAWLLFGSFVAVLAIGILVFAMTLAGMSGMGGMRGGGFGGGYRGGGGGGFSGGGGGFGGGGASGRW